MAETSRDLRDPAAVVPTGLRLRIWIGCLGAALLGAAGILGVAGTFLPVTADVSPGLISTLPWVAAAVPLLAGVLLALWLERGIVGPPPAARSATPARGVSSARSRARCARC